MKVKLFKEYNKWEDKLFHQISTREWIDIDVHKLINIDKKYLSKLDPFNPHFEFVDFIEVLGYRALYIHPALSKYHRILIVIWELDDEYFVIKTATIGSNDKYYKCDTWKGVVDCLKSILG